MDEEDQTAIEEIVVILLLLIGIGAAMAVLLPIY